MSALAKLARLNIPGAKSGQWLTVVTAKKKVIFNMDGELSQKEATALLKALRSSKHAKYEKVPGFSIVADDRAEPYTVADIVKIANGEVAANSDVEEAAARRIAAPALVPLVRSLATRPAAAPALVPLVSPDRTAPRTAPTPVEGSLGSRPGSGAPVETAPPAAPRVVEPDPQAIFKIGKKTELLPLKPDGDRDDLSIGEASSFMEGFRVLPTKQQERALTQNPRVRFSDGSKWYLRTIQQRAQELTDSQLFTPILLSSWKLSAQFSKSC